MTTLAEGEVALKRLVDELVQTPPDWTEADTRFRIIDRLLVECLGWPREHIRLETTQGRLASDYELGSPRQVIWEAKREGAVFELPVGYANSTSCDLRSLTRMGGAISEAIEQVRGYCIERGVEVAVSDHLAEGHLVHPAQNAPERNFTGTCDTNRTRNRPLTGKTGMHQEHSSEAF